MRRDRGWRRDQAERIVKKRLKRIKSWYTTYPEILDHLSVYQTPGYLKKWNFTCSCGMCTLEKDEARTERRQKDREYERAYTQAFRSNNF